jgi:hypothetical protein
MVCQSRRSYFQRRSNFFEASSNPGHATISNTSKEVVFGRLSRPLECQSAFNIDRIDVLLSDSALSGRKLAASCEPD